jgi:SET domain-containing protein
MSDPKNCNTNNICHFRVSLVECSASCGALCTNQFKKQAKKIEVRTFGEKGYGLVAMEFIRERQFVVEYVGRFVRRVRFANKK